ncbi:MAG: serine/threonine-protein phosphatase [Treponema sp.]|nr:serine/threonine-protein phosphatase [Treponema sp.]
MMYMILNVLAVVILAFLTKIVDKNLRNITNQSGGIVVALLILTIEAAIFTLTLIFHSYWIDTMVKMMLKIMFSLEAIFFTTLSFGFITIGTNKRNFFVDLLRILFYALGIYIVFKQFRSIGINYTRGLNIGSSYIFSGPAREFFPWDWPTIYYAIYYFILPAVGVLSMFILRERTATALQKYEAVLILEAMVIMWSLIYFIHYVARVMPSFSYLFIYSYLAFFVLIYQALRKTSVPSGRGIFFNITRAIVAYIIPAIFCGLVFAFCSPMNKDGFGLYEVIVILTSAGGVLFAWKVWDWIMYGSIAATNDYESNFEKGLASIDYTGEMDAVTERMFNVFKSNVECSAMGILVDDGRGKLVPAYSSNNSTFTLPSSSNVFDVVLNVGRSVLIYSEIDDQHEYDDIRQPLKAIFEEGKFDCMIILNEGHNIVGIITLGKKTSGDHYKEYDKSAFIKLYSYFFVFGYYVRNISNKEVLSTVNRELRMSSQIITSIQENIDHIKSHKADVGYMMVPAHNIGGEFIDLVRLTDTRHLVVVGDLSGKGIAASMNMVILKSIIRTYLAETHDFKKLISKINDFIRTSLKKGTIFEGLFALIDFETDTMYYINCGIPAMFLYTQVYNNVIEIQGGGHVLGFARDITPYLSVKTTKLNRGDIILACTDGLIDSHSLRGEKYGRERVSQAVIDNSTYPAQRMAQFTFEGLRTFMSKEMEDDVSIFVLKYKTSAEFAPQEEKKTDPVPEAVVSETVETTEKSEGTETAEVSESNPVNVPESPESSGMPDFMDDLPPEALAAMAAAQKFESSETEMTESMDSSNDIAESSGESKIEANSSVITEATETTKATEINDDFFVEDISSSKKTDEPAFEFDPKAFGLPDDFTL